MRQDEKHTGVIVGIAGDTARAVSIWEAFRKLFLDYADEVIEALAPIAEALSVPLLFGMDEPCPSAEELENLFRQIDENTVGLTGTPPNKYGMALHRCHRRTHLVYNYIPRTPRNLPYQRRAY